MANSDKNVLITPNRNLSGQPEINFTGFGNSSITLKIPDSTTGTLNFESSGTNLFSVDSNLASKYQFTVAQNQNIPVLQVTNERNVTVNAKENISIAGDGLILPAIDLVNLGSHEEGTIVFDKTNKVPKYNDGTAWINLSKPEIVTNSLVLLLDASNVKSSNVGISTNWSDISGYRNDGILVNGPSFNPQNGGTFSFDGVDDYVQLSSFFNFTQFTISFFVRCGTTQTTYADIFDNNHTGVRNFVFQQDANNLNNYGFGVNNTTQSSGVSILLPTEQWVHVGCTWNGSRVQVYTNGVLFGTGATIGPINYESQTLRIGGWQAGGRYWNGRMGNFIVYNRELSAREIQQNFNALRERFGI
jgi:hypothetical protein